MRDDVPEKETKNHDNQAKSGKPRNMNSEAFLKL